MKHTRKNSYNRYCDTLRLVSNPFCPILHLRSNASCCQLLCSCPHSQPTVFFKYRLEIRQFKINHRLGGSDSASIWSQSSVFFIKTLDGAVCSLELTLLTPNNSVWKHIVSHRWSNFSKLSYRFFRRCQDWLPASIKAQPRFWRCQSEPATDDSGPAAQVKKGILTRS